MTIYILLRIELWIRILFLIWPGRHDGRELEVDLVVPNDAID